MAYKITAACLKCGLCIEGCPESAIIPGQQVDYGGLKLQCASIDPKKCTDCGVCVSTEYWCPASAIVKA